jgi:ribosomal protein S18 acetylase RimI-like enzyme
MMAPARIRIRPRQPDDEAWIAATLRERWGAAIVVVHDELFEPARLPALVADEHAGLVTYAERGDLAEIITLDAIVPRRGIGTALLRGLLDLLGERGCRALCLTTTNDNLDALRFYQRRGFRLTRLRPDAVRQARRLKPGIPLIGRHGIPIRDEIDLRRDLDGSGGIGTGTLPP